MGKLPLAVGVPLSTPVLVLNETPVGSAPDSESEGAGKPEAVTVNELSVLTGNVALAALEMAGGWFTVRVKLWEASVPTPL